jgi:hypothetical protein
MAKDNPNTNPKTETPFQKFENLVRKLVRVPKEKVQKQRSKERRPSSSG